MLYPPEHAADVVPEAIEHARACMEDFAQKLLSELGSPGTTQGWQVYVDTAHCLPLQGPLKVRQPP